MNSLEDAVLVFKLIAGIKSVESPDSPVSIRRAALYARAAAYHGRKTGIDPYELVGLARHESDFNDKAVGPDGLDCGVTQIRVTYSSHSCEELKGSPWLAYGEAAKELAGWAKSCSGRSDFDRCRLNRYNSGIRYAENGFHGRYYLRVSCLAQAARQRVRVGQSCKNVRSPEELASFFFQEDPADRSPRSLPDPRTDSLLSASLLWQTGTGRLVPPPCMQRPELVPSSVPSAPYQPAIATVQPVMRDSRRREPEGPDAPDGPIL